MNLKPEHRPIDEFDEFFEAEVARMFPNDGDTTLADALQSGRVEGGNKQGSLRDIQVEFVRNPVRGVDFDARHNDLLITRELIETLLSGDQERIHVMEEQVAQSGGFLLRYQGEGEERLKNVYDFHSPEKGGWLMAETSAVPLGADGQPLPKGKVLGADGQFLLPQDHNQHLPEDFPLLDAEDYVLDGENMSRDIALHPSSAMLIADISAVREYSRYGFAAVTEDAAFARVLSEINAQRSIKIRYILAAIAGVKGLTKKSGEQLVKPLEPGIRNWRSLNLHTNRSAARGFLHGKQRNRLIDVELPAGDMGQLIVDWYVTIQDLEKVRPNTNILMFDEQYPPQKAA